MGDGRHKVMAQRQLRVATSHREIEPDQLSEGDFRGLKAFFGLFSQSTFISQEAGTPLLPMPAPATEHSGLGLK